MQERKQNRYKNFNYATKGAYFITVCTQDKKCVLSRIVGDDALGVPQIELSRIGCIVEDEINKINKVYNHINVLQYVIMPNHIHLIIQILPNGGTPRVSSPTISDVIGSFKRFVRKKIGCQIFQRSFYDRIIRDDEYQAISQYITENPHHWQNDTYFNGE